MQEGVRRGGLRFSWRRRSGLLGDAGIQLVEFAQHCLGARANGDRAGIGGLDLARCLEAVGGVAHADARRPARSLEEVVTVLQVTPEVTPLRIVVASEILRRHAE